RASGQRAVGDRGGSRRGARPDHAGECAVRRSVGGAAAAAWVVFLAAFLASCAPIPAPVGTTQPPAPAPRPGAGAAAPPAPAPFELHSQPPILVRLASPPHS